MALTADIAKLQATKARAARMEQTIAAHLPKELASLPSAYGFGTLDAFVKALKAAFGKKRAAGGPSTSKAKKRRRAVITDATRARVKALVRAGKPGSAIAKTLGISLPSVQNIKKALGLVQSRKAKASKPAPKKAARKAPKKKAPARKAPKRAKKASAPKVPAPKPAEPPKPAAELPKPPPA